VSRSRSASQSRSRSRSGGRRGGRVVRRLEAPSGRERALLSETCEVWLGVIQDMEMDIGRSSDEAGDGASGSYRPREKDTTGTETGTETGIGTGVPTGWEADIEALELLAPECVPWARESAEAMSMKRGPAGWTLRARRRLMRAVLRRCDRLERMDAAAPSRGAAGHCCAACSQWLQGHPVGGVTSAMGRSIPLTAAEGGHGERARVDDREGSLGMDGEKVGVPTRNPDLYRNVHLAGDSGSREGVEVDPVPRAKPGHREAGHHAAGHQPWMDSRLLQRDR